ncbi:hypothetical protein M8J77_024731 [Diaphorina citri]|nr:hypothetical protein M8J77_024731 [Diaphorina citri]
MASNSSIELKALEDPRLTLVEKLSAAQAILVSLKTCKIQVVQEILSWFVKTKDELMRSQNKSPAEIDLLYESLNKCIQITTMLHIPIYQIKFNIMDSLLKLLNIQKKAVSTELYLQVCLSILGLDNFVKCFQGDAILFTKFFTQLSWLFFTPPDLKQPDFMKEKFQILEKMVSILKKIKWNLNLGLQDMTDALVCVATLDHWSNTWQPGVNHIRKTLEQVFYSVSVCAHYLPRWYD